MSRMRTKLRVFYGWKFHLMEGTKYGNKESVQDVLKVWCADVSIMKKEKHTC